MADFPRRRSSAPRPRRQLPDSAWDRQSGWYDRRQGERGDDFHSQLILPAVLRHLRAQAGQCVLDCCCGNGVLGRHLAEEGVQCLGVDASPGLIAAAQRRAGSSERYIQGDAHCLSSLLADTRCDHAAIILALQDLDPIDDVLRGCAAVVPPGGRLVVVLTHPCFRLPKLHQWGWDEDAQLMYRRLDGYALPRRLPIQTHPGLEGSTASTFSYHRPLPLYLNALAANQWSLQSCEELFSHRRGSQGRRSRAEDAAHREFPVFLLLCAQRSAA